MSGAAPRSVSPSKKTGIAILGCGFVADYYMATLPNHPGLEVTGAYDTNHDRRSQFCGHYLVRAYRDFDEMLSDPRVEIVINLTPPGQHFATSQAALNAGKHVYSEKPLAMDISDAQALIILAKEKQLVVSAAPSSVLGEAPQAAWAAMRRGDIGLPNLVYAEMEDGMVFREDWQKWRSVSGAPWPGVHEFEVGCTLEHAGYYLTWVCAFFGPVKRMTAFSSTRFADKSNGKAVGGHADLANDLSIACLEHESGVVTRLSCGLVAQRDRSMTIIGQNGTLYITDGWDSRSSVRLVREKWHRDFDLPDRLRRAIGHWLKGYLAGRITLGRKLKLHGSDYSRPPYPSRMDFMRGPSEQAAALRKGRAGRLSAEFTLHVTELALAIQNSDETAQPYVPITRFEPMQPMDWA